VVEDNATNRAIIMQQLAAAAMKPTPADSAQRALQAMSRAAAAGTPYELFVLDMKLPDQDGISLARSIRADYTYKNTPIVLVTSLMSDMAQQEAREAGINAYISKPVRTSDLYHVLVRALNYSNISDRSDQPRLSDMGLKVLLVEDNPVNQEYAHALLERLGCETVTAENGEAAISSWLRDKFDVVLMDCQMPVMDGFQATRTIRQHEQELPSKSLEKPRRIPIIALTANAMEGDRQRCMAAGFDDYLAKPFREFELEAVLTRWVQTARDKTRAAQITAFSSAVLTQQSVPTGVELASKKQPALFDHGALEQLQLKLPGSNETLAQKTLHMYLKTTPALLQDMTNALQKKDQAGLRMAAHTLKSSSAIVGAVALSLLAKQLEHAMREHKAYDSEQMVKGICDCFEQTRMALEQQLRQQNFPA
jgi:CheY-like chemotaxis protein